MVYYNSETKVKNLEAIVYDEKGEEIEKFKKRDFFGHKCCGWESLYTDDRLLLINYTATSYPYTLEFNVTVLTEDTAFLPPSTQYPITTAVYFPVVTVLMWFLNWIWSIKFWWGRQINSTQNGTKSIFYHFKFEIHFDENHGPTLSATVPQGVV